MSGPSGDIRVGVLIPTFNRLGYLKLALSSALNQSHRNLEIVVIDNGSADGTAEYMRTVADPRVRYVVNPENIGVAGSVNRGIAMFSPAAAWCTVLCDDDLLHGDFVRSCVAFVARRAPKAIVDSHRIFIDGDGNVLRAARRAPETATPLEYIRARARFRRETYLTGLFFDRRRFLEIGGYPSFSTGYGTDDSFIFSLALRDKVYHDREAISFTRIHGQAESARTSGFEKVIASLDEFEAHVVSTAETSGTLSRKQLEVLGRCMRLYRAFSGDHLWRARLAEVLGPGRARNEGDIRRLLSLAENASVPFTARTRVTAFVVRRFGINPDHNFVYHLFWQGVKVLTGATL